MTVPISAPGSTLDDLYNDLAALETARRLARYGADCVRYDVPGHVATLYSDGAGAYEPDALVAWLEERISETGNTIDALEGAGPPLADEGVADPTKRLAEIVRDAVYAFPEAGTDEEINGADAVEWIVPWIIHARALLHQIDTKGA